MTDRKDDTVQITRKAPVSWLDLRSLLDVGLLAAVSATTDKRTPRREVLAALDIAMGAAPFADYSDQTDPVWLDYVADLGDGFDATHSIAWLIGRDCLALGAAGIAVPQPNPPDQTHECGPADYAATDQRLPAGKITIFGGDLVYPFATQTAYEDRTIGPYFAARPWQLTDQGQSDGRDLFAIPGNHDWYDGLGAFVQRFCQPGRWMGCWQVKQRRSYFAIKLPHQVWVWGVDLATADDFDAPQLEYFTARVRDLAPGDLVILCVPAPAWVYRMAAEGNETPDSRSWESWNKIDKIRQMVDRLPVIGQAPRVCAILAGDLHHYSRYETAPTQGRPMHLITCGGGGAYLLGTEALPPEVSIAAGAEGSATQKAAFPSPVQSKVLARNKTNMLGNNWQLFGLLGAVLLILVWYLDSAATPSLLLAVQAALQGQAGLGVAVMAVLRASPLPGLVLAAVALGFVRFAASDGQAALWRGVVAGLAHFALQLTAMTVIAAVILKPLLAADAGFGAVGLVALLALMLGWVGAGLMFAIYLPLAHALLNLHREEVFSAQGIADWKCFLRIRVDASGVTIWPVGLQQVCRDWARAGAPAVAQPSAPVMGWSGRIIQVLRRQSRRFATPPETFTVPHGSTHLLTPKTPLAPHLIEGPIEIRRTEAAP